MSHSLPSQKIQVLFETLQEEALPGVWSKGIAWSRTPSHFVVDDWKPGSSEWRFRVILPQATVHPRVTLWPTDHEWHCNCGDRNDPCSHTIAVVSALKNGLIQENSGSPLQSDRSPNQTLPEIKRSHCVLRYVWKVQSKSKEIHLSRELLLPNGSRRELVTTLVSIVGAHQTGRSEFPPVAASKEDFKVDQLLSRAAAASFETARGMPSRLSAPLISELLQLLSEFGEDSVEFFFEETGTNRPIRCLRQTAQARGRVKETPSGRFEFSWEEEALSSSLTRTFPNGALLSLPESGAPTLSPWTDPLKDSSLPLELRTFFQNPATHSLPIRESDLEAWVTRFIPALSRKITLAPLPENFPKLDSRSEPRVEFHLEDSPNETSPGVVLTPRVVYWNPHLGVRTAEWDFQSLKLLRRGLIPERKPEKELQISRELFQNYHLKPELPSRLTRSAAVQILDRFKTQTPDLLLPSDSKTDRETKKTDSFHLQTRVPLQAHMHWNTKGVGKIELQLQFVATDSTRATPLTAQASEVWKSWTHGESVVPLLDGGYAPIPEEWLRRNRAWLERFFITREGQGLQNKTQHSWIKLPEILSLFPKKKGEGSSSTESDHLWMEELQRKLLEDSSTFDPPQANISPAAVLRSYQKTGVDWLLQLRSFGAGALLADDMGLGKTLQALSSLPKRTLIICPTSVLYSWRKQIEQFFPDQTLAIFHGSSRAKQDSWKSADWVLTSYGVLRVDLEKLKTEAHWNAILIDEAQSIKNPESQTAQAAFSLSHSAKWRLALSGTPIENRVEELWSISHFINPGLLGPLREFSAEAREDLSHARRRIRPFLLRRLKKEVATELPPRIEETLICELSETEREVYDRVLRSKSLDQLQTLQLLEQLLRLRQSCADPSLLPIEWTQDLSLAEQGSGFSESSKTRLLMEQLEISIEAGHRSLVFSQWTQYLDRIERALERRKIPFLRIDGSTQDRTAVIEAFQKDSGPPVLLLSLKAGGVGLTLTAADHVYLLDPWWNPATEDQAADRAHRIGQTRSVLIRRLIAKDSVEERILELQSAKRELAAALFAKEEEGIQAAPSSSPELTRAELLALFQ